MQQIRSISGLVETLTQHSDGSPFVHFVSRVTGKGQLYFMNKYAPNAA